MSGANYEYCGLCESKALYVGEEDVPEGVEVVHSACLAKAFTEREQAVRQKIADGIRDYIRQRPTRVTPREHLSLGHAIEIARGAR